MNGTTDHDFDAGAPGNGVTNLTLDVASTDEGFDALEREWHDVLSASSASIFQTFDWLRTWWKHFHAHAKNPRLNIVVLRGQGKLLAIAPLFSEDLSILGLVRKRQLVFLGRRTSDYLDIIVRRGYEEVVYRNLARYFAENRTEWDLIFLEDIADSSQTHAMLHAAAEEQGILSETEITAQCPRLGLPASWEEYLAWHSRDSRHDTRRRERRLIELHDARFETIASLDELDAAFDTFVSLHQARWTSLGEHGLFAHQHSIDFQRDIIHILFAKGCVRLNFMRLNGVRTVASYSFVYGRGYFMYLFGMGDTGGARHLSPGRMLSAWNIRQAIEEGRTIMDFMRGTEDYKYLLLAKDQPNRTMTMYPQPRASYRVKYYRDIHLLTKSLHLRGKKEISGLRVTIRKNGLLSRKTLHYFVTRAPRFFQDARKKARAPLLPLSME